VSGIAKASPAVAHLANQTLNDIRHAALAYTFVRKVCAQSWVMLRSNNMIVTRSFLGTSVLPILLAVACGGTGSHTIGGQSGSAGASGAGGSNILAESGGASGTGGGVGAGGSAGVGGTATSTSTSAGASGGRGGPREERPAAAGRGPEAARTEAPLLGAAAAGPQAVAGPESVEPEMQGWPARVETETQDQLQPAARVALAIALRRLLPVHSLVGQRRPVQPRAAAVPRPLR
jgi:hypothetical protein